MLFNRNDLIARARAIASQKVATFDSKPVLNRVQESFSGVESYDIFLSHRYIDKDAVAGLADKLRNEYGLKVYVDWIVDPDLDRDKVNKKTADLIRKRMKQCKCLWYVTSENASGSKWMPWEVGFMDGHKDLVAICPLVEGSRQTFNGEEYLSLYPYISEDIAEKESQKSLWVNESSSVYCRFNAWLRSGQKPVQH